MFTTLAPGNYGMGSFQQKNKRQKLMGMIPKYILKGIKA